MSELTLFFKLLDVFEDKRAGGAPSLDEFIEGISECIPGKIADGVSSRSPLDGSFATVWTYEDASEADDSIGFKSYWRNVDVHGEGQILRWTEYGCERADNPGIFELEGRSEVIHGTVMAEDA